MNCTDYRIQIRHSFVSIAAAYIAMFFSTALFAQNSTSLRYDPYITQLSVGSLAGFEGSVRAAASKIGIKEKKIDGILEDFRKLNANRIIRPQEWRYAILDLLYKSGVSYESAEALLRSLVFLPLDTGFLDTMRMENNRKMDASPVYAVKPNPDSVMPDPLGAKPDVRSGPDVKPPAVLEQPLPYYTETARKVRVEGTVLIQLIVRKDGKPDSFKVLRGLGYGLDESSILMVKNKWRFKPGTYKEEPADVQILIETSFRLY